MTRSLLTACVLIPCAWTFFSCSETGGTASPPPPQTGSGGAPPLGIGSGGTLPAGGGLGGAGGTAGLSGTGGFGAGASGGTGSAAAGTGGEQGGGAAGLSGSSSGGGPSASGGSGGVTAAGGSPSEGGAAMGAGGSGGGGEMPAGGESGSSDSGVSGAPGSGGSPGTGAAPTGGGSGIGGGSPTGGSSGAGDGTGASGPSGGDTGVGGASGEGGGGTSEVCVWGEGPSAANGGLTCYWFSQGTSTDEKTCPGGYKTYCGYCGAETGERPQGDGQIWCPINDIVSTVANISTVHFAALPMGPLGQGQNCGMCIEITYRGRTITATVVDACPSCLTDEHVDLNLSAAEALGMTEVMGQVESGVAWRAVGCPTTEDIQVNFNGGYQGQVYFQNAAFPIAEASSEGRQATVNTGFRDFGMEMGGKEVTLTDVMGHSVTATVPTSPGSLGVQFDLSCQ